MAMNKEETLNFCLDNIQAINNSIDGSQLKADRLKAYDAYFSRPYGNEIEGRSQVIMSDVADTIEWIMPALMRIFTGGQDVVEISPVGKEDVEKAKLMNELINWQLKSQMNGFIILHDFMKDALLSKTGAIKYWWEKKEKKRIEKYSDLDELEMQRLLEISEEVTSVTETAPGVFSVSVKEIEFISRPRIENIPPEELLFEITAKNLGDSFVCHKKLIKKQEAKKYGLEESELAGISKRFTDDEIVEKRFADLGGTNFMYPVGEADKVFIYECFFDDYDDSGEKIPKRTLIIGDKMVEDEENSYEKPPFCILSPIRIPHRVIGRSIADLVLDLQEIKTILTRQILDNIYFQNWGMNIVNPYRVNADDLMHGNRPGGIIRTLYDTNPAEAIYPIPVKPLPEQVYKLVEYIDSVRENRVGVTKYNQGMDSKTLNKTASGISQIMSASQQRIELIARIFAETGIGDLFKALVQMNIDYMDTATVIKLNDDWKTVRPQDISGKFDVTVDTGIGTGTKELVVQQMLQLLNTVGLITKLGIPIFQPENLYNIVKTMLNSMGFKNANMYVTDPSTMQQGGMQGIGQPMAGQNQPGQGGTAGPQIPGSQKILSGNPSDVGAEVAQVG